MIGYPLQYSSLENSMDCTVHGSLKESDTTKRLSLASLRATTFAMSVDYKPTVFLAHIASIV